MIPLRSETHGNAIDDTSIHEILSANRSFLTNGSDGGSRTRNPGSRSPMLCPVELHPNPESLLSFNGDHAYWFYGMAFAICLSTLFSEHAFVSRADVLRT